MISNAFRPVNKQSLSDRLARRITQLIQSGDYKEGDRLPSIMEMARRFGVGHPTVRQALAKLETIGVVEIRHGSGVYVCRSGDFLVFASPEYQGTVTRKLLVDLIRARTPLEIQAVADAARHATDEHISEMRRLLTAAEERLADDEELSTVNMSFHRQIALASGNTVVTQLLEVLTELFAEEQRIILRVFGISRERDHQEHLGILEALEQRNKALAVERMRRHLHGVEEALLRWNPELHPVG
ncbi:MAG: FadR family transcriptional regulator [Gemmatimonadota bacterium]|nr:MAG: FadR family transcriptional regulator [Gemmatimonadota bacterium]